MFTHHLYGVESSLFQVVKLILYIQLFEVTKAQLHMEANCRDSGIL